MIFMCCEDFRLALEDYKSIKNLGATFRIVQELDKVDGGLFGIDLETKETSEFINGKFIKDKGDE